MSKNQSVNDYWKVKLDSGQIKGPYTTDAVCKMIVEGIFTGQELVIGKNQDDWSPLDKQPEFYEAVLEALENPIERDEKKAQKMDAETVIQKNSTRIKKSEDEINNEINEKNKNNLQEEIKNLLEVERKNNEHGFLALSKENKKNGVIVNKSPIVQPHKNIGIIKDNINNALIEKRDAQLTIELNQLKNIQNKQARKFIPIVLATVLLVLSLVFYFSNQTDDQAGWILIAPSVQKTESTKNLSAAEIKALKSKAILLIKSGTLENTRASQRFLTQAVEASNNDLESLGLLCVVYEQLWPYTKQTVNDQKAVTVVTQMARSINPISSYSDTCQAVNLLIKGQPKDARGLIEKTLDQKSDEKFILPPFLYYIKGQMFEESVNYINAEAYYAEAEKSFPDWNWALFAQARMLYKQGKYNDAKAIYERILKKAPEYKPALFGVALVEAKLESVDKAMGLFTSGYNSKSKLPKNFHVEALQEFIKILVMKGATQKALEVAQFGLTISPSHQGLKDLVISFGGEDKNNNTSTELVFLGDQFARSGDHLAAQAQYKAAFDFEPTNALIAIKTAKSLWIINQSRDALLWLDKAIKADPKYFVAYALKADYLSQKFNFVDASKTLAEASKKNPQNFDILKAQALVEYRKNNLPGSITYGERALKLYDADVELLSLLANANSHLYLNMPSRDKDEELKKSKYKEDAQKYASKAVDLEPGLPEAQITYSRYLYAANGSLAAENNLKKLIETFPYTFEYRMGLAEFYEVQEKYKSASDIYKQLVETDPKNKKALMGLARSFQYMNDSKAAQKYYMQAAVLDPSDVEPLFSTAQLELETTSPREASAMIKSAYNKFKMVKSINPNYPRISYFIGKCLLEMGEFDKAIELINEEKKKNPGIADPYILAATVYNAKQQYKECAAEYSLGIKLRPTSADLYVKAASCYRKSEALDIAQDMIEIARQKEDGYAAIYLEQGYIHEARGMKDEAIFSFKFYLELSPNAVDRNQVEAKIKSLSGR